MFKTTKRAAGVMLDEDVLVFLAAITGDQGRGRSRLINYIIRLYAQQLAARATEPSTPSVPPIDY